MRGTKDGRRPYISRWWPPKVILTALLLGLAGVGLVRGPLTPAILPQWTVAGQALLVLGAAIHLHHYLLMRRAAFGSRPRLVTRGGLFPWIRHPMYLGDFVMSAGAMILARDAVAIVFFILLVIVTMFLSNDEDRDLEEKWESEFRRWRTRSSRLLPWIY